MYTGYILKENEILNAFNLFQRQMYISIAQDYYAEKKEQLHQRMDDFIEEAYDEETHCVLMKSIEENFFPNVRSQVFLSHSSRDKENALMLAGYLWDECKIEVFIDSMLWGYCDVLLRQLDEFYSRTGTHRYNYGDRNITTAQVHVLLNMALARMINNTECFVFLESENSITNHDRHISSEETASPWIYSELLLSEIIQKRTPKEHRIQHINESVIHSDSCVMPTFVYNAMLSNLHPLRIDVLKDVVSSAKHISSTMSRNKRVETVFDLLYKETGCQCDE